MGQLDAGWGDKSGTKPGARADRRCAAVRRENQKVAQNVASSTKVSSRGSWEATVGLTEKQPREVVDQTLHIRWRPQCRGLPQVTLPQDMQQLRPEQRQVLELSISHGLSQSQIAEATNLPLGTVKTHARRGLMRLRELLGADQVGSTKGDTA